MEPSAENVRRKETKHSPVQAAPSADLHAFDATTELYARSELEERVRRIDRSIEKAKRVS
jgi:hypothetical protein